MNNDSEQRMDAFIAFGPFRLFPAARLLERHGIPVTIGSRAFDILITLVAQPGDVVSKDSLVAAVWPDTAVVESALRVHITNLRKALCDGEDGARYVANVAGRGYCFVASISHGTSSR
jgi:DNA-binding winged helix-turn-helix (wHTH) protein